MTKKTLKRKFNDVQPHKSRLTNLAQTANASAHSPTVHPDPRSTWADSPEQGLWPTRMAFTAVLAESAGRRPDPFLAVPNCTALQKQHNDSFQQRAQRVRWARMA
jgi:hypothetical protein